MTTREISIGGLTLKIASLNCAQVEELTETELPQEATAGNARVIRERVWSTIMSSLGNAKDETSLETLRNSLDLAERNTLHEKVFELSGLKAAEPVQKVNGKDVGDAGLQGTLPLAPVGMTQ